MKGVPKLRGLSREQDKQHTGKLCCTSSINLSIGQVLQERNSLERGILQQGKIRTQVSGDIIEVQYKG